MSRIQPIMRRMAVEKRIENPFYPQTFKKDEVEVKTSLQPTNPDPESHYSPTSPTPELMAAPIAAPVAIPPPAPRADYTSGAARGPHHQPKPFDSERAEAWSAPPQITWTAPPEEDPNRTTESKLRALSHRCLFCNMRGHFNYECLMPHLGCEKQGRCVVPLRHRNFGQLCGVRQRTMFGGVGRKRGATDLLDLPNQFLEPSRDTPAHSGPNESFRGGNPPSNSLLFSPNPSTFPQEEASSPGWNQPQAPWGAPWNFPVSAPRSLSPCIFDFGRGSTEDVPLSAPYLLDEWEAEQNTLFAKEDLPGATHLSPEEPDAPTASSVAGWLRNRFGDMGISG